MADNLRLFSRLAPGGFLDLRDFNDGLRVRINGEFHPIAGRNGSDLRGQGRIPCQELISCQTGIPGQGNHRRAAFQFDFLDSLGGLKL